MEVTAIAKPPEYRRLGGAKETVTVDDLAASNFELLDDSILDNPESIALLGASGVELNSWRSLISLRTADRRVVVSLDASGRVVASGKFDRINGSGMPINTAGTSEWPAELAIDDDESWRVVRWTKSDTANSISAELSSCGGSGPKLRGTKWNVDEEIHMLLQYRESSRCDGGPGPTVIDVVGLDIGPDVLDASADE